MSADRPVSKDFEELNEVYDECINYLKAIKDYNEETFKHSDRVLNSITEAKEYDENGNKDLHYEEIQGPLNQNAVPEARNEIYEDITKFKVVNETTSTESIEKDNTNSNRLRKLSLQLPKIIITNSTTSLNEPVIKNHVEPVKAKKHVKKKSTQNEHCRRVSYVPSSRNRFAYGDYPKRLVAKNGNENVALISNVPFEKMRMLNDTFHTLINLRWRWIVMATVVLHFAIWLVFAGFWYIAALAHYDFEPDGPKKTCVTGGKDFITIFLASVEAQTTIGFGDRAIDEECPESIFLLIMQLILGTGLSGVLTCVVYAKLTRPENFSKDGVGFSKKAVICMRDGRLCLMARVWDLNHDHIISSELTAHFVSTHKTKEGEIVRHYARHMLLQQQQFLLWPVTIVHVIDQRSPLYKFTPEMLTTINFEITITLKGASASMGTFTQSQTSYLPREIIWGHRFLSVVKYDPYKMKYVIDHKKLEEIEPVDTPLCSARELYSTLSSAKSEPILRPGTPSSFSEKVSGFTLERSSSFRNHKESKHNAN